MILNVDLMDILSLCLKLFRPKDAHCSLIIYKTSIIDSGNGSIGNREQLGGADLLLNEQFH